METETCKVNGMIVTVLVPKKVSVYSVDCCVVVVQNVGFGGWYGPGGDDIPNAASSYSSLNGKMK